MKTIFMMFMAAILLLSGCATVDPAAQAPESAATAVYSNGQGLQVMLHETACTATTLKQELARHTKTQILKATVTYQGRVIGACWTVLVESGVVLIADTDGDVGAIPLSSFHSGSV